MHGQTVLDQRTDIQNFFLQELRTAEDTIKRRRALHVAAAKAHHQLALRDLAAAGTGERVMPKPPTVPVTPTILKRHRQRGSETSSGAAKEGSSTRASVRNWRGAGGGGGGGEWEEVGEDFGHEQDQEDPLVRLSGLDRASLLKLLYAKINKYSVASQRAVQPHSFSIHINQAGEIVPSRNPNRPRRQAGLTDGSSQQRKRLGMGRPRSRPGLQQKIQEEEGNGDDDSIYLALTGPQHSKEDKVDNDEAEGGFTGDFTFMTDN
mmetsp:Transcript_31776/g.62061  ORF Transcript_31776/g.62061 Transcript_31776/m.62061 type:complete len:263 (-) Transcript_31776:31-819(-)